MLAWVDVFSETIYVLRPVKSYSDRHHKLFPNAIDSNTIYGPGGARGAHSFVVTGDPVLDPDKAWLAWVGNNTLDQMTSTFSHELVEMCTDPEGDSWAVDGQPSGLNEIGDACNLMDVKVNGVLFESYWSKFETLASSQPAIRSGAY